MIIRYIFIWLTLTQFYFIFQLISPLHALKKLYEKRRINKRLLIKKIKNLLQGGDFIKNVYLRLQIRVVPLQYYDTTSNKPIGIQNTYNTTI